MEVDELAEELADFWFTAVEQADWQRRLHLLNEIHAQLLADLESKAEYHAVSPRFVAAIIERLGTPPVEHTAQAQIYASSAIERHREASAAWSPRRGALGGQRASGAQHVSGAQGASGFVRENKRRFPRQAVDAPSKIWVRGHAAPCRLVDLSPGGARVVVREPAPEPGTTVRLAVPETGVLDATVVFSSHIGIGVRFTEQPLAA